MASVREARAAMIGDRSESEQHGSAEQRRVEGVLKGLMDSGAVARKRGRLNDSQKMAAWEVIRRYEREMPAEEDAKQVDEQTAFFISQFPEQIQPHLWAAAQGKGNDMQPAEVEALFARVWGEKERTLTRYREEAREMLNEALAVMQDFPRCMSTWGIEGARNPAELAALVTARQNDPMFVLRQMAIARPGRLFVDTWGNVYPVSHPQEAHLAHLARVEEGLSQALPGEIANGGALLSIGAAYQAPQTREDPLLGHPYFEFTRACYHRLESEAAARAAASAAAPAELEELDGDA